MDAKRKLGWSELKVGIFVVLAVTILAVAIFTIGTQVGFFENTFAAKTYLNNVSGLKPGDIVLLGGVEVGNVTRVEISSPGKLPETQTNQQNLQRIAQLQQQVQPIQNNISTLQSELTGLRSQLSQLTSEGKANSAAANSLQEKIRQQESELRDQVRELGRVRDSIEQARGNLQNIAVYMQIISSYRDWIRSDSSISLGSVGLLGDKYIEISLGRTDVPPPVVEEPVDTWHGAETRQVVLITGTTQAGFQELITGANDILANFQTLSSKLTDIMDRFDEGKGSVGKFFNDPAFYNNLNSAVVGANQAVDQATKMLKDVTQGPGTIPRLIQNPQLYDRIDAAAGRLEDIMSRIENGEGTAGQLVKNPALYDNANQTLQSAGEIAKRIQEGQGTLGQLATNDKVYKDLQRSLDEVANFMSGVEKGKGTLGQLATNDELYNNINKLSTELVKLIYDFRQNPKKYLTIKLNLF